MMFEAIGKASSRCRDMIHGNFNVTYFNETTIIALDLFKLSHLLFDMVLKFTKIIIIVMSQVDLFEHYSFNVSYISAT